MAAQSSRMGSSAEANNEELQALKQEVVIMRDRLEHHPEVKRFAGRQHIQAPQSDQTSLLALSTDNDKQPLQLPQLPDFHA